jgi:hypothetical protein
VYKPVTNTVIYMFPNEQILSRVVNLPEVLEEHCSIFRVAVTPTVV